jgi:hypothetical protein
MCVHLSDGETAIKEEAGTGDKMGSLRRQINAGSRTFFGRPKTTRWGPCDYFFVERHCFQGCHHRCVNKSGGDGVHLDINRFRQRKIDARSLGQIVFAPIAVIRVRVALDPTEQMALKRHNAQAFARKGALLESP